MSRLDLYRELEELVGRADGFSDFRKKERAADKVALLDRLYKLAFKKSIVPTCGNCLEDAWWELRICYKNNKELLMEQIECEYQLRAGVIIRIGSEIYSNANLTAKVAEEYLRMFPENISDFAKIPEKKETKVEAKPRKAKAEPKLVEVKDFDIE